MKEKKVIIILLILLTLLITKALADDLSQIIKSGIIPGTEEVKEESPIDETYLVLMGILISNNLKEALLFDKKSGEIKKIKEGESIDNLKLIKIYKEKIVLKRKNRKFTLTLFSEEAEKIRHNLYSKYSKRFVSKQKNKSRTSLLNRKKKATPALRKTHPISRSYKTSTVQTKREKLKPITNKKTKKTAFDFVNLIKRAMEKQKKQTSSKSSPNPFLNAIKKR